MSDVPPTPPTTVYVQQTLPPKPPLSVGVAYVLLVFLGVLGIHRFYMGKIGTGILWLLTGGLLGIGWLVDLFITAGSIRKINERRALGLS